MLISRGAARRGRLRRLFLAAAGFLLDSRLSKVIYLRAGAEMIVLMSAPSGDGMFGLVPVLTAGSFGSVPAMLAVSAQPLAHLRPLDIAVVAIYFGMVLWIGFYLKGQSNTGEDFFLAGREMTAWIAGLSFVSANLGSIRRNPATCGRNSRA